MGVRVIKGIYVSVWTQQRHRDLSNSEHGGLICFCWELHREGRTVIDRPKYDAKWIGHNLKRLRLAKKLTVDEVRRYLGVGSVQAVYKYEEGKSYPPADTMFALMQLYEADLYDILCGCDQRPCIPEMVVTKAQWRSRMSRCIYFCGIYVGRMAG